MHCTGGAIVTGPLPVIRLGLSTVRRFFTWGLVAAVAALVAAAGIDALRGGEEAERPATVQSEPTLSEASEPPGRALTQAEADLREAGVPQGRLIVWDEDCVPRVLLLPDLAERPVRGAHSCRRDADARGGVQVVVWPAGIGSTECIRGRLRVWAERIDSPQLAAAERGCGAAWKPDGTLTFVQDGSVRRFVRCPDDRPAAPLRCSRPVFTRTELARQLRGVPWSGYGLSIKELRWLDNERFAAIMRARSAGGASDYLVIVERGRLVREPIFAYADLGSIRPSPTGRLVAAYDRARGGVVVANRAGESVQLAMDHGDGIAWSPDEEWIAEATEEGVYVFRADEDSPEFIQIPVVASDLVWEKP